MDIKEFYYINELGLRVGPVPFEKITSLQIKPDTFVWFEGLGDGWRRAADVEEIKRRFAPSKPSSPTPPPVPAEAPRPSSSTQTGKQESKMTKIKEKKTLSDKDKKTRMFVLVFGVVFGLITTAALLLLIPMISSLLNSSPYVVGAIIGGVILLLYLLFGIIFKSKKIMIPLIVMGVIFGVAQPLISYSRFDYYPRYDQGFLQSHGDVYNNLGLQILSNGNSNMRSIASSSWGDIILDIRYDNELITIKGYDHDGNSVIYDEISAPGYEIGPSLIPDYSDREEMAQQVESYLSNKYYISVHGKLNESNIHWVMNLN